MINIASMINALQTDTLQNCTKFKFSHFKDIDIDHLKLILEDGRKVDLRDNYKDQINKLLNDTDAVDRTWLIASVDFIGFFATNGNFLPLVVDDETTSQNNSRTQTNVSGLPSEMTIFEVQDISDDTQNQIERIHIVLDQSGSMNSMNETAYAGARELINGMPQDSIICFTTFSSSVHLGASTSKEYALQTLQCKVAQGSTSLYDAICDVVDSERNIEASIKTIVIVTDGMDTSSRKSQEEARVKVSAFQNTSSHRVLFLGSNQNACLTAQAIGIPITRAMTYGTNEDNMRNMFRAVSLNNQRYRSLGTDTFTQSERDVSVM